VKKYLLVLFVIALALSACSAGESSASLIGSWKLVSYGPADALIPAVPDTEAGITFNEDGTLTGNSGCNGFGGNYTMEADQVTFSDIVSTLIACEERRMEQENIIHQVLSDTATFKVEGNTLTLTNHGMVLVLTR
jgi:heat shock protein HslJ